MKIYFCSVHSSHQVFWQKYIFKEFICNDDTIMFWNTAEIQLQCTLFLVKPPGEKKVFNSVKRERECEYSYNSELCFSYHLWSSVVLILNFEWKCTNSLNINVQTLIEILTWIKKYYNLLVVDLVVYEMLLYLLLMFSAGATIQSLWLGAWIWDLSLFGVYGIFRFAHFGTGAICYPVWRVACCSLSIDFVTFVARCRIGLGLEYVCHSHSELNNSNCWLQHLYKGYFFLGVGGNSLSFFPSLWLLPKLDNRISLVFPLHVKKNKIYICSEFWKLALHKKGETWQNFLQETCYCLPDRVHEPHSSGRRSYSGQQRSV